MCSFDTIIVILKNKNLKQKDLTNYLGLSENAFSEWKSGRNKSWRKYLPQIADFLGVSVDELLGKPAAPAQFSPQKEKLVKLIDQLDEPDMYKLEGVLEEMLRAEKYITAAKQA